LIHFYKRIICSDNIKCDKSDKSELIVLLLPSKFTLIITKNEFIVGPHAEAAQGPVQAS